MSQDLFSLRNKVALVTGSTRGIGKAIASQLCQAGALCIISSEKQNDVEQTVAELNSFGFSAVGQVCDVADKQAQETLVQFTMRQFGRLDVLVCNAGITGKAGPIEKLDEADYRQVFDINLHSIVQLCNMAQPLLGVQGGSIILMSSISALRGNAHINAYALAKAGVSQLARNLAVQWGPQSIRTNAIAPGLIRTELSEPLLSDQEFMRKRLQMTPLRRVGEMEEIGAAARFLASPAGAFVNGQTLVIDGGTCITDGS